MKKKGGKNVPNCVPEKISTFKDFKEEEDDKAQKLVKIKIKRDKKRDAIKHDRMMDVARTTDTKRKNKGIG